VITFEDAPPADEPKLSLQPEEEIALPPGMQLEVALESSVDLRSAAAGDPVTARLERAVKQSGEVIVPKGARVMGRVARMERQHPDNYAIALAFTSVRFDNRQAAMAARLQEVRQFAAQPDRVRQALHEPDVIVVRKSAVRLPAGLRLTLATVAGGRR
jgi:hypothetical protein